MNNRECDIARDLMPLCIDRAASEASREMVVKHVWECEECAGVYAQMQGRLLTAPTEERDELDAAARRLRRRRKNRRRLLIALTALLTAALVVAAFWGYMYAFHLSRIPLGLDEYAAALTRTQGGDVLLHVDVADEYLSYSLSSTMAEDAEGRCILTVTVSTSLVKERYDTPSHALRSTDMASAYWQDGLVWADRDGSKDTDTPPTQISCIRVVSGNEERILYQAGDDIPFCSPEMDAYYTAQAEYEARVHELLHGEQAEEINRLRQLVPEWQ